MKKNIIITIILVVIACGGGFFAGMKYQQSVRSSFSRQLGTGQGAGTTGAQNRGRGGSMVAGDVINVDDKSITVKLQDGSSKIVIVTETTTISKASDGTKSDLKVGGQVAVFGSGNSDGSVTAQNIQLNPQLRMNQRNQQ